MTKNSAWNICCIYNCSMAYARFDMVVALNVLNKDIILHHHNAISDCYARMHVGHALDSDARVSNNCVRSSDSESMMDSLIKVAD